MPKSDILGDGGALPILQKAETSTSGTRHFINKLPSPEISLKNCNISGHKRLALLSREYMTGYPG